jgi:hypothetical protein
VGENVRLVIDATTRESIPLELPLRPLKDPEAARTELGLGKFVDLTDPPVARAVGLLQALRSEHSPAFRVGVFGGTAFRLRFPSSNSGDLGLRHPLHDLDLACLYREAPAVRSALLDLGRIAGSALTCLETRADRTVNTLGGGKRFRFHLVEERSNGGVGLAILDLICDEFRFCHTFDLVKDLERGGDRNPALSPELLLLTKLQFIQRIPAVSASHVSERVLGAFGLSDVLIGPEAKDLQDVLALLHDVPLDAPASPAGFSVDRVCNLLSSDWGAWTTVRMNLTHLPEAPILQTLPAPARERVRDRIGLLLNRINALHPRKGLQRLRREWWETVDTADDRIIRPEDPRPGASRS